MQDDDGARSRVADHCLGDGARGSIGRRVPGRDVPLDGDEPGVCDGLQALGIASSERKSKQRRPLRDGGKRGRVRRRALRLAQPGANGAVGDCGRKNLAPQLTSTDQPRVAVCPSAALAGVSRFSEWDRAALW